MSYRPLCDMWILARPKVKYYGAFPAGFLQRARDLLGVSKTDPVLHVCGGMVKDYPYSGFGPNDATLDSAGETNPDYLQPALDPLPTGFKAALIDPPYTEKDAENYNQVEDLPSGSALVKHALKYTNKVGILHYVVPRPPKDARFVAVVGVFCGYNNKIRAFSVFENKDYI